MIGTPPDVLPRRFYTLRQAAEALAVHPRTARRYIDDGLLISHLGRHNGRRFVLGADITKFWKNYFV